MDRRSIADLVLNGVDKTILDMALSIKPTGNYLEASADPRVPILLVQTFGNTESRQRTEIKPYN